MNKELIPVSIEQSEGLFDLNERRLFSDVFSSDDEQIEIADGGFDHYFIFNEDDKSAVITDERSGRIMTVTTTFPGMILYTGDNMDEAVNLNNSKAQKYAGLCVDAPCTPAAMKLPLNHDVRISAGVPYNKETVFSFDAKV